MEERAAGKPLGAASESKQLLEFAGRGKEAQVEVGRSDKQWELSDLLGAQPRAKSEEKREGERRGMARRDRRGPRNKRRECAHFSARAVSKPRGKAR